MFHESSHFQSLFKGNWQEDRYAAAESSQSHRNKTQKIKTERAPRKSSERREIAAAE